MNVGDLVTRKSYNNDIIFVIKNIRDEVELSGKFVRLMADARIDDLVKADSQLIEVHHHESSKIRNNVIKLSKKKKGYLTGKILHLDGDSEYLEDSLKLYRDVGIYAVGYSFVESDMANHIERLLKSFHPEIVVITGHDSFNKLGLKDLGNYQNSSFFIKTILKIREKFSLDDVFIIAGACGSHFEALIAAGANLASSPERVNVHAFDPSIAAIIVAITPFNEIIKIDNIYRHSFVKREGLGGIESYGKMRLLL